MTTAAPSTLPPPRRRLPAILALLLLAPMSAEFMSAAAGTFGGLSGLLTELAIATPIYGTVALLIREFARRAGRGWPTILLLGAGFGLIQAGLIDQGLFNPSYIDDPSWGDSRRPTLVPGADFSVRQLLSFVGGHMIWSFAAPIAVIEACVPRLARRRWLGGFGITVTVVGYLLGAAFVFSTHLAANGFLATPGQLGGAAVVAAGLIVAGFAIPRSGGVRPGWVPPVWSVGVPGVAAAAVSVLAGDDWIGVAAVVVALAGLGGMLLYWSVRDGWTGRHVLVSAVAPLLVNAGLAFSLTASQGPSTARYVANTIALAVLLGILLFAWWRSGPSERSRDSGLADDTDRPDGPVQPRT